MNSFPRRGEIWFAGFPGDPKHRPAVIVSSNARNELSNSVLAVPLTTNLRPSATHTLIPMGEGGISEDSMARCENVSQFLKSWLDAKPIGGSINTNLMNEIERCLMRALGIPA